MTTQGPIHMGDKEAEKNNLRKIDSQQAIL